MDLVCARVGCTNIPANKNINCLKCKTIYCSQECLKQEPEDLCFLPEPKQFNELLRMWGLKDSGYLPKYNGVAVMPLPGPIKGSEKLPPYVYPVDREPGKSIKEKMLKSAGEEGREAGKYWFYIIAFTDMYKVFFKVFTEEQRDEVMEITRKNQQEAYEAHMKRYANHLKKSGYESKK